MNHKTLKANCQITLTIFRSISHIFLRRARSSSLYTCPVHANTIQRRQVSNQRELQRKRAYHHVTFLLKREPKKGNFPYNARLICSTRSVYLSRSFLPSTTPKLRQRSSNKIFSHCALLSSCIHGNSGNWFN